MAKENPEQSNGRNEQEERPGFESRDKYRRRGGVLDWIDAFLKLVIALIGVGVTYLGYEYQKSYASSQLLVQQEKGDISIRAQMFGKITDRLMKPTDKGDSLLQDVLLTQMLALNFHELIELKPLMIDLDKRLNDVLLGEIKIKNGLLSDYELAQKNLKSIARRIRSRQVTALVNGTAEAESAEGAGHVFYINVIREGNRNTTDCISRVENSATGCMREQIAIPGHQSGDSLLVSVDSADWTLDRFQLSMHKESGELVPVLPEGKQAKDADTCSEKQDIEEGTASKTTGQSQFEVTWYDFPFTDNTLSANGGRHAVFIDSICRQAADKIDAVKLGILYFPKDYYPSRERPVSYKQLNRKLGTEIDY